VRLGQIRKHFHRIAAAFAAGDFQIPMIVHDTLRPGANANHVTQRRYVGVGAIKTRGPFFPRIVAELTSKDVGQLFATTDSERMKKTLESAGFVQKGMSGSDHEENFRYGAKK
jgi:hypothetical protein